MTFSATNAAFEGFRVVRRKPMALVFWALFYIVIMLAAFAAIGGNLIGLMGAVEQLDGEAAPSIEAMMPLLQTYLAIIAIVLPLSLVASAVIYAAIARAVVRPNESAFGYLRLGADEVRVLVVSVAIFFVMMAAAVVIWGVVGVVIGLVASADMPALWVLVVLLCLGAIALFLWLGLRLSLAIPITVAERRIAIFDSFAMTKGRFWPLLGMGIIAVLMSFVVSLLGSIVMLPVQMATGTLGGLADMEGENLMAIAQAAWPAILGWVVINAVLQALQVAVVYAPFSAAYRDIKGGGPNAAVFD